MGMTGSVSLSESWVAWGWVTGAEGADGGQGGD